mgnify:CR=1 FL=1
MPLEVLVDAASSYGCNDPTCPYECTYVCLHICMCLCLCYFISVCMTVYICTHTHTHTYTYTYTHTQRRSATRTSSHYLVFTNLRSTWFPAKVVEIADAPGLVLHNISIFLRMAETGDGKGKEWEWWCTERDGDGGSGTGYKRHRKSDEPIAALAAPKHATVSRLSS